MLKCIVAFSKSVNMFRSLRAVRDQLRLRDLLPFHYPWPSNDSYGNILLV